MKRKIDQVAEIIAEDMISVLKTGGVPLRVKDVAETIKQFATLKGLYASYKTAMSGTIYMIVKQEKMSDHWLKIRIGRHKLEDSKHYPNDKFKTDDVDVDLYKVDGKWDLDKAIKAIEERYVIRN